MQRFFDSTALEQHAPTARARVAFAGSVRPDFYSIFNIHKVFF
jgi:hypothetical protein